MELNKILGAVFASLLLLASIGQIAKALYHPDIPKGGVYYKIDVADSDANTDGNTGQEEIIPSVLPLLATADAQKGEKIFKKCKTCHSINNGGPHGIGPNLWGIVGKKQASAEGYSYSSSLAAIGKDWSIEELNKFLYKPKKYASGTKMSFKGLKKTEDRAAMILYLRNLSNSPVPLPEPALEPASGGVSSETENAAENSDAAGETMNP